MDQSFETARSEEVGKPAACTGSTLNIVEHGFVDDPVVSESWHFASGCVEKCCDHKDSILSESTMYTVRGGETDGTTNLFFLHA